MSSRLRCPAFSCGWTVEVDANAVDAAVGALAAHGKDTGHLEILDVARISAAVKVAFEARPSAPVETS